MSSRVGVDHGVLDYSCGLSTLIRGEKYTQQKFNRLVIGDTLSDCPLGVSSYFRTGVSRRKIDED